MRRLLTALTVTASLALFTACAETPSEEPLSTASGELVIEETSTTVNGTFEWDGALVEFSIEEVDELVFDTTVWVNGMGFDALISQGEGVASLDGFAEQNGADTQILEGERLALMALYRRLNDDYTAVQAELSPAFVALRRVIGSWAQQPTSVELSRAVLGENNRTINSLCSYIYCRNDGAAAGGCDYWNWYTYATHDDWDYDRWDSESSQIMQLGDHYSCNADQFYWDGSTWVCGEPDHWSYPYEIGNCLGRSGGTCGGDTQYTADAADHDGCVGNGHTMASLWCDDEFTSAVDDELFADNCY